MQPSARKFGNEVRKCLKENAFEAIVTSTTTCFAGFGYGAGVFAIIKTIHPVPINIQSQLRHIQKTFESQADEGNHFIISLAGEAYPFGGRISLDI